MTYEQILSSLKKKEYSPIYLLAGEEPFFIDLICDYITENVLSETDKAFNQTILYGQKDMNILSVIDAARRFPMMAEKQVVVFKEAQIADYEKLAPYAVTPQPSTILVICVKYKKPDKRTALYKAVSKNGVVFESAKIPDYKMPEWIAGHVKSQGLDISAEGTIMLSEFLGNDLIRVVSEVDKLKLTLPEGQDKITPSHIERNTGYSKEFNYFELQKAIISNDPLKAQRIVLYFEHNPKSGSLFGTIAILFSFFTKVFAWHFLQDKSQAAVASALKCSPYAVKDIEKAAKRFPPKKISAIFSILRTYDAMAKGLTGTLIASPEELLKEMVFRIMH